MIQYIIKCPNGRRWAVLEAKSLKAACNAVSMAMVSGSIGSHDTISEPGKPVRTIAHVHRINSDGTFAEAYQTAY